MRRLTDGFTLVELLAAIVVMGLLTTAVLAPMTGLFRQTSRSAQTLQATTQAQGAVETIRGQWRTFPTPSSSDQAIRASNDNARDATRAAYDLTCYTLPSAPTGVTITVSVQALNRSGTVTGTQDSKCGGTVTNSVPVMKRITVTATVANRTEATLSVDIPRPPSSDPQQITN